MTNVDAEGFFVCEKHSIMFKNNIAANKLYIVGIGFAQNNN